MKTLKFKTLLLALVSAVTMSSCLNDSEVTDYPTYSSYVTVSGDAFFGYTFHSDFGCTLLPTSESILEVIPGLNNTKVERLYVAFDLVPESENGKQLEPGRTYKIALKSAYGSNIAIPTYSTIDTYSNQAAVDSLTTKNGSINAFNSNIWAINGYANAEMTILYDYNKPFYMHTYYNHETDIDLQNKTMYLNVYYNDNASTPIQTGRSVFSFNLPQGAASEFLRNGFSGNDTITLVMKAMVDHSMQLAPVGECKMSINDFYKPGDSQIF